PRSIMVTRAPSSAARIAAANAALPLPMMAMCSRSLSLIAFAIDRGAEPCIFDRGDQRPGIGTCRVEYHACLFGIEIRFGLVDAIDAVERAPDGDRAHRAVHVRHRQHHFAALAF